MCLILLGINEHENFKLVVAANRDEFYERPTAGAEFWENHPDILAGKDLKGGGTWLGINRAGRISMLTNFRDPGRKLENPPTRGRLVSEFLIDSRSPREYINRLRSLKDVYNGYNLLLGNPNDIWHYSNVSDKITRLGSGIYGLSNHLLDTPWPKVEKGKKAFASEIKSGPDPERLLDLLYDSDPAPDQLLPDTGVDKNLEKTLSPVFIKSPSYGTRCSTVMTVNRDDVVTFVERTYDLETFDYDSRQYTFSLVK